MTGLFELKSTKLKGQFSLLSLRYFCKDKGIDLTEVGEHLTKVFNICDVIYFACKAYYDLNDKEFTYNKMSFTNVFAKITQDELDKLVSKLHEVELFGAPMGEAQAPTSKKK